MSENIRFMRRTKLYSLCIKVSAIAALVFFISCISGGVYKAIPVLRGENKVGIRVPIIMYHGILKNESRSGKYVITPWQFEYDLKYLREHGYTTIFMQELIDYVYHGSPLPQKPIVLTFDDGCYNNKEYALPLLEKYDLKAVISIVGAYTDTFTEEPDENPNYAYLSWQNVRDIMSSGRIEIQNHSNNMHKFDKGGRKGCYKMPGETMEQYLGALAADLEAMQEKCRKNLDYVPQVFTYPYGSISPESAPAIKECGFTASLSCIEGINIITGDKDELYMLKRCIRTDKRDVASILSELK